MTIDVVILVLILLIFTTNIILVNASDAFPTYQTTIEANNDFMIDGWEELPFKHQKANQSWVAYVNDDPALDPFLPWNQYTGYDENGEKVSWKCLSHSAATVAKGGSSSTL